MLTDAFSEQNVNFEIFYSVKTNFSKPVLDTVNKHCHFEVVSAYEWTLIKEYRPKELVLNGPSKTKTLVRDILDSSVEKLFFNIDNDTDILIIENLEKKYLKKIVIGLRVYLNRPGIWNRFGYDINSKRADEVIIKFGKKLQGFHFHFSTNNFSINNYSAMFDEINKKIAEHKLKLQYVDIGGGLPGADEMLYQKTMYKELPELVKKFSPKNVLIISEVGRNLVENAFDLETEIVSTKELDNGTIDIVIDANIMHFPCFWEKKYSIEYVAYNGAQKRPTTVNIFGNSCMQIDKIAESYLITNVPVVGDRILLSKVGAYSLSQASNFISKIPDITE